MDPGNQPEDKLRKIIDFLHTRPSDDKAPDDKEVKKEDITECEEVMSTSQVTSQSVSNEKSSETSESKPELKLRVSKRKLRKCAPRRLLQCLDCGKIFTKHSALQKHESLHSENSSFKCHSCEKMFIKMEYLLKHLSSKHGEDVTYNCSKCEEEFKIWEEYKEHNKTHTRGDTVCKICAKTLVSRKKLTEHLRTHSDARPFKCENCGKAFKQRKTLYSHKKTHEEKTACSVCSKNVYLSNLTYHMESSHGGGGGKFECETCGKVLTTSRGMQQHKGTHDEEKPFSCDVCNKVFRLQQHLEAHAKVHSEVKDFPCDVCKKAFSKRTHLQRHMQLHSENRQRLPCKTCGKTFANVWNLQQHEKLHSDERPFTCTICSKGFISQYYLQVHHLSHSGVKSHKCDICGKSFGRIGHLNQHRKIHTDTPKNFKCEQCGKEFRDKHGLKKHVNYHTKPFECTVCRARLPSQYKLNLHLRSRHPYPDQVDPKDVDPADIKHCVNEVLEAQEQDNNSVPREKSAASRSKKCDDNNSYGREMTSPPSESRLPVFPQPKPDLSPQDLSIAKSKPDFPLPDRKFSDGKLPMADLETKSSAEVNPIETTPSSTDWEKYTSNKSQLRHSAKTPHRQAGEKSNLHVNNYCHPPSNDGKVRSFSQYNPGAGAVHSSVGSSAASKMRPKNEHAGMPHPLATHKQPASTYKA